MSDHSIVLVNYSSQVTKQNASINSHGKAHRYLTSRAFYFSHPNTMAWFNPNWNPNWNRNSSVPSYSAPQGQPLTPQLVIRGFQPPPTTTHYSIMVHLNMAGFTFPAPQHRQQSYAPPGMQIAMCFNNSPKATYSETARRKIEQR